MIQTDEYFDYDYNRHEYYLKPEGLIKNTLYSQSDLIAILGADLDKVCKFASQRIYREAYQTNYNRQAIQYKIYINAEDERQTLYEAIIEYLKGALESGMDMRVYTTGENDLPRSVHNLIGKNLLYQGQIQTEFVKTYGGDY